MFRQRSAVNVVLTHVERSDRQTQGLMLSLQLVRSDLEAGMLLAPRVSRMYFQFRHPQIPRFSEETVTIVSCERTHARRRPRRSRRFSSSSCFNDRISLSSIGRREYRRRVHDRSRNVSEGR